MKMSHRTPALNVGFNIWLLISLMFNTCAYLFLPQQGQAIDLGGIAGYAGELERGSDPQKEEK